jgi:hypothetical protein
VNKFIIALLCLASSMACAQKGVAPKAPAAVVKKAPSTPKEIQHSAMHYIAISAEDDSSCTGYAVSKTTVLTAEHCTAANAKYYLDHSKTPAELSATFSDGHDHVLLVFLKENFEYTIVYNPSKYAAPVQGEHAYLWGNPGVLSDQYREGYFSGTAIIPKKDVEDEEIDIDAPVYLFVSAIAGGDSGSAIFDATTGALIGVVTYGFGSGNLGGTYALAFTPAQVSQAEGMK